MLKDITIGQYFPGKSIIHKLDPRIKIILVFAFLITIFVVHNFYSLGFLVLCTAIIILISGVPVKLYLKSLKAILPIIVITAILNIFYVADDRILFHWKFIKITMLGIETAIFMGVRIILLILISSVLTYTSSPTELTDGIERLMSPLKYIKLDVHSIVMMMTIALRFVPTLIEETDKIMSAQKSRGADLESGGLAKRAKALLPVIIPLFVSAFRRAYELAYAMDCRCYNGGEGKTTMKILKLSVRDYVAFLIYALTLTAVILLNIYL
jgi:energy-coupling factor transport system permease protein